MSDTHHSFDREHTWYPRHVSDRADELIDELDESQCRRLFDALKAMALSEWFDLLETSRNDIVKYDALNRAGRKRRLAKDGTAEPLLLHHGCIFVELWRARTQSTYFHFPPTGPSIATPEAQRDMLLAVLTSFNAFDLRDLWPFEFPEGEEQLPFRRETTDVDPD
jgi:hypothetical protein